MLYNYDDCKNKSEIVVCEGITDVWAYHEINIPAVASFGSHITKEQYKLLLKTGADLIFSFDGDEAGINATNKVIKMFQFTTNISTINLCTSDDPESITREELIKKYEQRQKLN